MRSSAARAAAARAGHLPCSGRTTIPSNLGGSRACAVLPARPLCHRSEPGTERPGDKGAREGNCFRPGPSPRAGDRDPLEPVLCDVLSNSAPSLGKRLLSRTGVSGILGSLPVLSRPPLPVAPLRTPNSQIWGFSKSRGTHSPVAWTTGRRTGPPLTSAVPPGGRGHPAFVRGSRPAPQRPSRPRPLPAVSSAACAPCLPRGARWAGRRLPPEDEPEPSASRRVCQRRARAVPRVPSPL